MKNTKSLRSKLYIFLLLSAFNCGSAFANYPQNEKIDMKGEVANQALACGANAVFYFKQPVEERVNFSGFVEDPRESSQGAMLYPAPSAAGFLAAILTHAVISGSVQDSQRKAHLDKSNEVLQPFLEVIDSFKGSHFLNAALTSVISSQNKKIFTEGTTIGDCGFLVELETLFTLTQDKSAILVSNIVNFSGNSVGSKHRKVVRVISAPNEGVDMTPIWLSDHGSMLQKESVTLLGKAIDLAINSFLGVYKKEGVGKTVRYKFGLKDKFERAQIFEESCKRVIFKTLRGELFSVPIAQSDESVNKCKDENE